MPPAHAKSPDPTAYATPRTIRPYSLGQNREWDAVSRMLAAGLVTVCADPMARGFVRVEMVRRETVTPEAKPSDWIRSPLRFHFPDGRKPVAMRAVGQYCDGVWTEFEGVLTHNPKEPRS